MDYKDIKTQVLTNSASIEEMFGNTKHLQELKELFVRASFEMLSHVDLRKFVGTLNNMSDKAFIEIISDPDTHFETIEYEDLNEFSDDLRTIRFFAPLLSALLDEMGKASEEAEPPTAPERLAVQRDTTKGAEATEHDPSETDTDTPK